MVAERLGFALVDTGLFYRAVTVEARRRGIGASDVAALVQMVVTAPAAERVARRRRELDRARGSATPDAVLEQEIEARDRADQEREVAPLRAASDAIIVATEGKSVHQVFDEVMAHLPKH